MLKLKAQVVEKLSAIIVEKHLPSVVKAIEEEARLSSAFEFSVLPNQSKSTLQMNIPFAAWHFEEVEALKPNIWFPREKWEGNPNGYMVVQALDKDMCKKYGFSPYDFGAHPVSLRSNATHFMYVEPLGENK